MSAPLPGVLQEIAEACGEAAALSMAAVGGLGALSMAARFGGRRVYIPRPEAIGEDHPLAQVVGLACARRMADVLVNDRVLIPLGPRAKPANRRQLYAKLKAEGRTNSYIAEALGVHLRTVGRYGLTDPRASNQPDLFG